MAAIPEAVGLEPGAGDHPREVGAAVDQRLVERLVRLVPLAGDESDRVTVRAPFSDEVLGSYPRCTPQTVRKAVRRARFETLSTLAATRPAEDWSVRTNQMPECGAPGRIRIVTGSPVNSPRPSNSTSHVMVC